MDISPATRRVYSGLTRSSTWAPRPSKRFSTSSIHAAARVARPALARSIEQQRQPVSNPVRAPVYSKPPTVKTGDLWPTAILKDANRLGLLTITAEKAVEVMRDIEKRPPLSPEQIFKKHDLKPSDVTLLARVLLRTSHTTMARDLLLAAAKLNNESAIFLVIQEALRRGSLGAPGVDFIYRTTFKTLVEKAHPKALYLEAQLCERQGNNDRALALYEKLVAGDTEDASGDNDVDYGAAWMAISRLKARKGDRTGVGKAIERAAFRFDNPAAYYQLAKVLTSPSAAEYEGFLLKAAASGELKAAHELGVLYFSQSQGRVPMDNRGASNTTVVGGKGKAEEQTSGQEAKLALVDPKAAIEKRKLAEQWFALGADAGLTGSLVYLAALLHKLGKFEEGLQWLQAARNSKDSQSWIKAINYLREHWELADTDFSRVDIEGIR